MHKVIPLIFLLFIASGCEQSERVLVEPKADVEVDTQAIKDIIDNIEVAVNTSDLDKLVSFCADDMIRILPNEPPLIGKEAYRSRFHEIFERYILQEKYLVENILVSGDLAVVHIIFSVIITPKDAGEPAQPKLNGNWILVFKRQPDAAWKVIYSMTSDERLVYPTQATVATDQSPFIGTWKLNLDKSKFIVSAPLEWTDVFREIEDDQYEVTAKTVLADGTILNEVIVWPRQGGVATFLQGGTEGAIEVLSMISPNEMVATRMVDGKQIGLINIFVSQDGKTLRYTIRYPGEIEGEGVFDKQ